MKQYLIDTFNFNDGANRRMLEKIKEMPEGKEAIKLFSHLINCQYKWLSRILQDPKVQEMDWWDPLYELGDLEMQWNKSLSLWIEYVNGKTDEELSTEVTFIGFDGGLYAASPQDIALQLNYHSIHHRAQIQIIIREQGSTPDFVDYIGTKYRKLT